MVQRVAPQLQWLQHNPLITSQRVKSFFYLTGSTSQTWRAVLLWNLTGGMVWPEIPSKSFILLMSRSLCIAQCPLYCWKYRDLMRIQIFRSSHIKIKGWNICRCLLLKKISFGIGPYCSAAKHHAYNIVPYIYMLIFKFVHLFHSCRKWLSNLTALVEGDLHQYLYMHFTNKWIQIQLSPLYATVIIHYEKLLFFSVSDGILPKCITLHTLTQQS